MANKIKRSDIAERLVDLRKNSKRYKNQQDVADALGIKRDTYARYETATYPPIPIIRKLTQLYGVSCDKIINGDDSSYQNTMNESIKTPQVIFGTEIEYKASDNDGFLLSEIEWEIITYFRNLSEIQRNSIINFIRDK